jgi:hypothetical protein
MMDISIKCCNQFGERHEIQEYINKLETALKNIAESSAHPAETLKCIAHDTLYPENNKTP